MDDRDAPPAAYGRATNTARFAVLHRAASTTLESLAAEYLVERREHLAAGDVPATVGLFPARPGAGPLTIEFTTFPGLLVRAGRWRELSLPHCGCDACDEDPDDLLEDLRDEIDRLVTGRLAERLTHGSDARVSWGLAAYPEDDWGWTALSQSEARRRGPAGRIDWAPWPRR